MKNKLFALFALTLVAAYNFQVSSAHAQGTTFTYQGRVLDNGTNFTGAGQFQFALVTSTNFNHTATATANAPSGGFITGYVVTGGGSGYVTAPAVTIFGGGGSGAAATANLSGGVVTSLTVASTGNGAYTSAPTVTIAPPPANISYATYWSNDGTSVNGSEPTASVIVGVTNGLFTVVLGDATVPNMLAIEAALFNQPNLQLRIWFNDGVNGFAALSPVQTLTPAPYATYAASAGGLPGLSVQSNTNGAPNVVGGAADNYIPNGVVGATISGGGAVNYQNVAYSNTVTVVFGTVSGGRGNSASGDSATVGGGYGNVASNSFATVAGGYENVASGYGSAIGGGGDDGVDPPAGNTASGDGSFIGGGVGNVASGEISTVSGGLVNSVSSPTSTIGGGDYNTIVGFGAATVAGGEENIAGGDGATVGGGAENIASGDGATIGGGNQNSATNVWATVPGGALNVAGGQYSFAAGLGAQAIHDGAFVWNDRSSGNFSSTAANQFAVHAAGGVVLAADIQMGTNSSSDYHHFTLGGGNSYGYLYGSYTALGDGIHLGYNWYADSSGNGHVYNTGGATSRIDAKYGEIVLAVGGVNTAPGTVRVDATTTGVTVYGTFNNSSDRNAKQDIAPVSSVQILDKVLTLPVSEWSYKEDASTRHIGPMGQDFYSIFNIGTDEKHIAPIDEGGVALAAIQGLNQKLQDELNHQNAENAKLKQQNDSLAERLNELEATVKQLVTQK